MNPGQRVFRVVSALAVATFSLAGTFALGQAQSSAVPAATGPVAYVYVSTAPTSKTFEINAYAVAPNGALAQVSGSPFAAKGNYIAVNGKWLFDTNTVNIDAFAIQSNGALQAGPSVNAQAFNKAPTGGPINLFFDRTSQSLYDGDIYIDGSNDGYQSWGIVEATGQLDFKQDIGPFTIGAGDPLSFIANNQYGYSSSCVKGTPDIYGYRRSSNGTLHFINVHAKIPPSTVPNSGYCPYLAAADNANHVAISLTPFTPYYYTGPPQIAVYTAQPDGTLTTASNAKNMPVSAVGLVAAMRMSPSGKLLAVGGTKGLQLFHFNGARPATRDTGLLTKVEIDQVFWDKTNHLYAVSKPAGKLFVFTVTATGVQQAPGSPYAIPHAQNLAVLAR